MIGNDDEYRKAAAFNDDSRRRIDGLVEVWEKQGLDADEIKRLRNPMMSLHLQFVEEAEAWRMENYGPKTGVQECAAGFVVAEPQSGAELRFLYYGRTAAASRMDMLAPDELFPTFDEAEERMLEMFPPKEGCMGPPGPSRDEIAEMTEAVLTVLRHNELLQRDEESMCQPLAESRRRALWLLEKVVEEVLIQNACETF